MTARVELLYDGDCPNVGQARAALLRAFATAAFAPHWQEWRLDDSSCPHRLRGLGSPTILVGGRDVSGYTTSSAEASCCRVYFRQDGSLSGVPSVEQIADALRHGGSGQRWSLAAIGGPALGVTLLPKLVCPACWPAYAAVVSALGMSFLLETRYLLPLTAVALGLAVLTLAWKGRQRRGYGPALLALAASSVMIAAKFGWNSVSLLYGGMTAFIAAFIWNAWPLRDAAGQRHCAACETRGVSPQAQTGGSHEHQTQD